MPWQWYCPDCGNIFRTRKGLESHKSRPEGHRPVPVPKSIQATVKGMVRQDAKYFVGQQMEVHF